MTPVPGWHPHGSRSRRATLVRERAVQCSRPTCPRWERRADHRVAVLGCGPHESLQAAPTAVSRRVDRVDKPHPVNTRATLLDRPHIRAPGEIDGFWPILRATAGVRPRGNDVPDAHLAALMRQHGVRVIYTRDRDFRRFDGIDARDPFG
jgi:hypothetical protein